MGVVEETGRAVRRQTDECDERAAQYCTIPLERAKAHTLQSRSRVDAQQDVGRESY